MVFFGERATIPLVLNGQWFVAPTKFHGKNVEMLLELANSYI